MAKQKTNQQGTISGVLKGPEKQNLPGLLIQAFNQYEGEKIQHLGTARTDENGKYFIRYKIESIIKGRGAKGPNIFLRVSDQKGNIIQQTDIKKAATDRLNLNVVIPELRAENEPEKGPYHISGKVLSPKAAGVAGQVVQLFLLDMPGTKQAEMPLGNPVITSKDGSYHFEIPEGMIREFTSDQPDFLVRVLDDSGTHLQEATKFKATRQTEINLILSNRMYQPPAEFDVLNQRINARISDKLRLDEVKEDQRVKGISYLSRKTGYDARLIAMRVQAEKQTSAAKGTLPPDFFYALMRAGYVTKPEEIYRVNVQDAMKVYKKAAESKMIKLPGEQNMKKIQEAFVENSLNHVLENKSPLSVSTLDEILQPVLGKKEDRRKFAQLYFHNKDKDINKMWDQVEKDFSPSIRTQLQFRGKLGYLTFNNAGLMTALERKGVRDSPDQLIGLGLYNKENWEELVKGVEIPDGIEGADTREKKENYINWMTGHLQSSYPTEIVVHQLENDAIKLFPGQNREMAAEVVRVLKFDPANFTIGKNSINRLIADYEAEHQSLNADVKKSLQRLHRVYQLSPDDQALQVLLDNDLDSAFTISRYSQREFLKHFANKLEGGETTALKIYNKAKSDAGMVSQASVAYLTQKTTPLPYVLQHKNTQTATGVKTYPQLEQLFGSLDFCSCSHCESVLSPASYFVDLLQFIDLDGLTYTGVNPIQRLLQRRPDLEHIELSCENTNTVLPYIDLVNEILEYFIIHPDLADDTNVTESTIDGFTGYNIIPGANSEDLLALPQFFNGLAYDKLKTARYPLRAPFDRNLAVTRHSFEALDTTLAEAMEILRPDERIAGSGSTPYNWHQILTEQLHISPGELNLLSVGSSVKVPQLYGYGPSIDLNTKITNAKIFCRRMNITYFDCVELLKTSFINPGSLYFPALEFLQERKEQTIEEQPGLPAALQALTLWQWIDGIRKADAAIETALSDFFPLSEEETVKFGGDLQAWILQHAASLMSLIALTPVGEEEHCDFEEVKLSYTDPDLAGLDEFAWWKLVRFTRLKNQLGLSIQQLDEALLALFQFDQFDLSGHDVNNLHNGLYDFIIRYALCLQTEKQLKFKRKTEWQDLLALWGPVGSFYRNSLYNKSFIDTNPSESAVPFEPDFSGNYFTAGLTLESQLTAIKAGCKLSDEDWLVISGADPELVPANPLTMERLSRLFRYGLLSRKLKISVEELIDLALMGDLDPIGHQNYRGGVPTDFITPDIIQLIRLAETVKTSSFKIQNINYLLRHKDVTGKSGPDFQTVLDLLYGIRRRQKTISNQFPTDGVLSQEQIYQLFVSVYGADLVDLLFATIAGRPELSLKAGYTHNQENLQPAISAVDEKLKYNHLQNMLSYQGIMPDTSKTAFDALGGLTAAFSAAIQSLYDQGQEKLTEITLLYPEIQDLYDKNISIETAITENIRPVIQRLKTNNVLNTLASGLQTEYSRLAFLLATPLNSPDQHILNASGQTDLAAIEDFMALDNNGSDQMIWYNPTITGNPDLTGIHKGQVNFNATEPLPPRPGGGKISGRWSFYIETDMNGFHSIFVEADTGAQLSMTIDGQDIDLQLQANGSWKNNMAITLEIGKVYRCELQAEEITTTLELGWQRQGTLIDLIPANTMVPVSVLENAAGTYMKLLKSLRILENIPLSDKELNYFVSRSDFLITGNESMLNHFPVEVSTDLVTVRVLFDNLTKLWQYHQIRSYLKLENNELIDFWQDPMAVDEDGQLRWYKLVPWTKAQFDLLVSRIPALSDENDLVDLTLLERMVTVDGLIKKTKLGLESLLVWTTNTPDITIANALQGGLRNRFSEADWRKVLKKVSNPVRRKLRDALVDFVLIELQKKAATANINTPEKLFEYFLIDPLMEPCMKTSRIKQAISSVQLFVHRCLLNLEQGVDPSSINAEEWEWKKRYRVAEAAKKVFLYPENWLDPSLRTTKSPEFKELEGELAQSDLSNDLAIQAILSYLEKVDQIAHLQIVSVCRDDEDRIHVVGHNAGTTRSYYHRVYDGIWSAWEKISLDVEGNPVSLVFWRDRLFLFWVTLLPKGDETDQMNNRSNDPESFNSPAVKRTIEVTLNWSEFYNGKWKPKHTSDLDNPLVLKTSQPVTREGFEYFYYVDSDDSLVWALKYQTTFLGTFRLYNKYSLPLTVREIVGKNKNNTQPEFCKHADIWRAQSGNKYRRMNQGVEPLDMEYHAGSSQSNHRILADKFYKQTDFKHPFNDIYTAPFFCTDFRHAFLATIKRSFKYVHEFEYIGPEIGVEIPDIVFEEEPWQKPDPVYDPGYIDPVPWQAYTYSGQTYPAALEELGIEYVLKDGRPIEFENVKIGVHGQII